jgi:hypothetical protein
MNGIALADHSRRGFGGVEPKSGSWLANVYSLVAFHNLR